MASRKQIIAQVREAERYLVTKFVNLGYDTEAIQAKRKRFREWACKTFGIERKEIDGWRDDDRSPL